MRCAKVVVFYFGQRRIASNNSQIIDLLPEITNPNSTRYAQATHFYFEGCNHYYSPMFSDVANGVYSDKDLTTKDILNHKI
jgi:hypothetical protein